MYKTASEIADIVLVKLAENSNPEDEKNTAVRNLLLTALLGGTAGAGIGGGLAKLDTRSILRRGGVGPYSPGYHMATRVGKGLAGGALAGLAGGAAYNALSNRQEE
jgi:hypothetical protein